MDNNGSIFENMDLSDDDSLVIHGIKQVLSRFENKKGSKKKRSTTEQMDRLVTFIEKDNSLNTEGVSGPKEKQILKRKWEGMARTLNEMGPAKRGKHWKEAWRDLKNRSKKKWRLSQCNERVNLTEIELRVLQLIGTASKPPTAQDSADEPELHYDAKPEPDEPIVTISPGFGPSDDAQHQTEEWSPSVPIHLLPDYRIGLDEAQSEHVLDPAELQQKKSPAQDLIPDEKTAPSSSNINKSSFRKQSCSSPTSSHGNGSLDDPYTKGIAVRRDLADATQSRDTYNKSAKTSTPLPSAADFLTTANEAIIKQGEIIAAAIRDAAKISAERQGELIAAAIRESAALIAQAMLSRPK